MASKKKLVRELVAAQSAAQRKRRTTESSCLCTICEEAIVERDDAKKISGDESIFARATVTGGYTGDALD